MSQISRIVPSAAVLALRCNFRPGGPAGQLNLKLVTSALAKFESMPAGFHLLFACLLNPLDEFSPTRNKNFDACKIELENVAFELLAITARARGNVVIRGKAVVLLCLLGFMDVGLVSLAFENQYGVNVDKLSREQVLVKEK